MEILIAHRITRLVDVRGSPYSWRKKWFNREAFEELCRKANIEYLHCGELGNKSIPIEVLIETANGIKALEALANDYHESGDEATVIMCAEHDSEKCHRKFVSQRLYDDYQINVTHIRRDATTFPHVIQVNKKGEESKERVHVSKEEYAAKY